MILRAVAVGVLTLLLSACVKPEVALAPTDLVVRPVVGEAPTGASFSRESSSSTTWDAHDEVDVEWRGRWWPATVLERKGASRYLVHYDGFSEEWDEVVGPSQIRLRTASAPEDTNEPVETDADP